MDSGRTLSLLRAEIGQSHSLTVQHDRISAQLGQRGAVVISRSHGASPYWFTELATVDSFGSSACFFTGQQQWLWVEDGVRAELGCGARHFVE